MKHEKTYSSSHKWPEMHSYFDDVFMEGNICLVLINCSRANDTISLVSIDLDKTIHSLYLAVTAKENTRVIHKSPMVCVWLRVDGQVHACVGIRIVNTAFGIRRDVLIPTREVLRCLVS